MEILSTTHPIILNFFNEHKNIDFESVNLLFVQLLEKILNNNDSIQKSSADKIFSSIHDLCNQFENYKNNQEMKEKNLHQELSITITNIKNDHVNELTKYIDNKNELSKHEIKSIIDKITEDQNNQIQKNIQLLLLEQFPKDNHLFNSLKTIMENFSEKNRELIQSMDGSNIQDKISSYMERLSLNYNQLINNYQETVLDKINNIQSTTNNNLDVNNKLCSDVHSFINKYKNSSLKGQFSENKLSSVLNETFTTAEVINTSGQKCSCDYLLKREDMPDIYFENKDYDRNVPPKEITKFIRDIEEQDSHGIFLSQNSGITSKNDYYIDIHKNNVLVYLHNVNYDPIKIKTAVDIIDHLSSRIDIINTDNKNIENIISQENLESINREYNDFISRKTNLLQFTRDHQKKLIEQINLLDLPNIEKYLNSKFANIQSSEFICDICNKWKGTNLKSLAAHKRSCKNKQPLLAVETDQI